MMTLHSVFQPHIFWLWSYSTRSRSGFRWTTWRTSVISASQARPVVRSLLEQLVLFIDSKVSPYILHVIYMIQSLGKGSRDLNPFQAPPHTSLWKTFALPLSLTLRALKRHWHSRRQFFQRVQFNLLSRMSAVSYPRGVWGGTPAEIEFGAF